MNPLIPTDVNTRPLNPPTEWDQKKGACGVLSVVDIVFCGYPAMASLWKPDADEIAAIVAGNPIMLIVNGSAHPPVALAVASNKERVIE